MRRYGKVVFPREFPLLLDEWDFDKNKLSPWDITVYDERGRYIWWRCKEGHSYIKSLIAKTGIKSEYGTGCPICNASAYEQLVYKMLDGHDIVYECEFMPLDMEFKGRFDIHILDKNIDDGLLIELDGRHHFEDTNYGYGTCGLNSVIWRDNIKNEYAFKHGFTLLRVPYIYFEKQDLDVWGLIAYFLATKRVPKEVVKFYSNFKDSNYAGIVTEQNRRVEEAANFVDLRGL